MPTYVSTDPSFGLVQAPSYVSTDPNFGLDQVPSLPTQYVSTDPNYSGTGEQDGLVEKVNRALTGGEEAPDALFYKTGLTRSQREELNQPLRDELQTPVISPDLAFKVLQALNTTDEQGPVQQGIDREIASTASGMTSGEGVANLPLYAFPPTAIGLSAQNVQELPGQVGEAATKFGEGDIQGGASAATQAGLNALQTAGVLYGGAKLGGGEGIEIPSRAEPEVPPAPPPPIGAPLQPIPLLAPDGSTPAFNAVQAQAPPPISPPAPPPVAEAPLPYTPEAAAARSQQPSGAGPQPQAGEGVPVAPATEGNPPGITNRYVEEQIYRGELPPEAMATGTGTTARAAADEARARLAQDPNLAFQAARRIRNGSVQGGDTALLHAYNDQLAEGAAQARQAAFANPGDAGLRAAADNAEKAHVQFLQDVKPLAGGLAQRIMVGFQGAYPPDLSTYAGMYKEMTQLNEGRPVPNEIRSNLYRRAAKVQKAAQAEKAAGDRLQQAMDKNLPKRPVPTKEQMVSTMEEFKRKVAPCP